MYIHLPFCETKCHYCDFYSLPLDQLRKKQTFSLTVEQNRLQKAIQKEIERRMPFHWPLGSLFLGGGTPSLMDPALMEQMLDSLWKRVDPHVQKSPDFEWSMEANPSSLGQKNLQAYYRLGVRRVSLGIQSLQDHHLQWLGRVHSAKQALKALENVFEAGFQNVSVDLMCGIPGQSLGDLKSSISILSQFPITHLSCYLLTLSKTHRLFESLPSDETQIEHYLFLHELMKDQGFDHYEISNFAKGGLTSKHNLNYWKGGSYLGCGPSAHSFDALKSKRSKNVSSLHHYCQKIEAGELAEEWNETLTPDQKNLERWMLSLRLSEGFPQAWLNTPALQRKAEKYIEQGLLEPASGSNLRCTPRGFTLCDQIVGTFV